MTFSKNIPSPIFAFIFYTLFSTILALMFEAIWENIIKIDIYKVFLKQYIAIIKIEWFEFSAKIWCERNIIKGSKLFETNVKNNLPWPVDCWTMKIAKINWRNCKWVLLFMMVSFYCLKQSNEDNDKQK